MKKIKNKKDKQKFLNNLYLDLKDNLEYDIEFHSMTKIINKMYKYDKDTAIDWSFNMIKKYIKQAIPDKKYNYTKTANINDFLKDLLTFLVENLELQDVILLISSNILDPIEKIFIWGIIFNSPKNIFIEYLDNFIINEDYDAAYKSIETIIDKKNQIDKTIFDQSSFLFKIIRYYVEDSIINEDLLNFLYSLEKFFTSNVDKAVFKSFFIESICGKNVI